MSLAGVTIAVVAGDRREQEIARCAAAEGAEVRAYGFPWPEGGITGVRHAASVEEALRDADFALFPIPGIAPDGALFAPTHPDRIIPDRKSLSGMKPGASIILGWADPRLRGHCEALGISLHEYEWDRELMLLRGPAIVEGLLRVIIENTDITIHRANICCVGYGTVGALVARTLVILGARVHVVARNPVQRAEANAAGAEPHDFAEMRDALSVADIVVFSVPAQVLQISDLETVPKDALLVDLAAPPGGIDREAVDKLGLKFVWARGLGSRAPVTVGRSQWGGVRRRIDEIRSATTRPAFPQEGG
jgi:dipicolinate synthase subunit A